MLAALFLSCTAAANGGPVLLGSFDAFTNGGSAPHSDPRLQFILQLPTTFPPNEFFGLGMDRDIFWEDGDLGSAYFDASNDSAFESFALHATDGVEDLFMLSTLFPSGGGDGNIGMESQLFGVIPDLIGNTLDYVELKVFDVRIDPWIPDPETHPEIEGFTFEAFPRYEFYGTPVPEPAMLCLLATGTGMYPVMRRTTLRRILR